VNPPTISKSVAASHALTSIPWPVERNDFPAAEGVDYQVVTLFEPALTPRLKRYLLLTHRAEGLPNELRLGGSLALQASGEHFSEVTINAIHEALDTTKYVYRECDARISVAGKEISLRMGLLPNNHVDRRDDVNAYSWWQWARAERLWSGPVAEAWRIGGHLVPYTIDAPGKWNRPEMTQLGDMLNEFCGDILHGDLFAIIWRDGLLQLTAHFKSTYFHTWPKPVPAFPVLYLRGEEIQGCPGFSENRDSPGFSTTLRDGGVVVQPWDDLRLLANKDKHDKLFYLPPEKKDVLAAGVSRTFRMNISVTGGATEVARYHVPASWYRACGVIEADATGPAAQLGARNAQLIRESTEEKGIDAGRVWRYLRRWEKLSIPQEDGAEWEGNLAQAMFTLAYQLDEDPAKHWQTYLDHAYHAADVSVYHGAWMGRLECTAAFTAPLPKFRFGGFVYGYLETGDPYLLELARSLAGVYMAMEWALQPRSAMGRDTYPLTCLMALWDYSGDQMYLDFARQTAIRLLSTQQEDGSFSSQAGAGVLTGVSAKMGPRDIHFGSGILSPIALLEWATRDDRWPEDFIPRLRRWADLMLRLQKDDGHWYVEGKSNEPYTLTGSGTVWSLIKAGEILKDRACVEAVRRYLKSMNDSQNVVLGTHAFLSAQYAHVADAVLG
jgi:hypothetical protein